MMAWHLKTVLRCRHKDGWPVKHGDRSRGERERSASWKMLLVLLVIALLLPGLSGARAEGQRAEGRRVALIIGNGAYAHATELANPRNDAQAIAEALRRVGFAQVIVQEDLDRVAFQRALQAFTKEARSSDMALVFYAGHGIEMGGQNFLIPVDATLASDVDVAFEAVPLDLVMRAVEGAKRLRIVLLDACRNNPFATRMVRSLGGTRSVGRGLARIEPPGDMLVAYAAKDGQVAEDGIGTNSPFTEGLLKHIETPGLEIQFLLRKVRDSVLQSTSYRQEPHVYGSLGGDPYYLMAPVEQPKAATQSAGTSTETRMALDLAFWQAIESSGDQGAFEEYLRQFPEGVFAGLAKLRLSRLSALDQGRASGQVASLGEQPIGPPEDAPPLPEPVAAATRIGSERPVVASTPALPPLEGGPKATVGPELAALGPASLELSAATAAELNLSADTGDLPSVPALTPDTVAGSDESVTGSEVVAARPLASATLVARPTTASGRPVNAARPGETGGTVGAELKVAALDPQVAMPASPAAPTLAEKVLPGVLIRPQAKPTPPPSEAVLTRAWLQEIPCTIVDAAMQGAEIDIVGHSANPDSVAEAIANLEAQGLPKAGDVRIEPLNEALCPPIDLAREQVWSGTGESPGLLAVRPASREFFVEDRVVIELDASRGLATAALFSAEGTVRSFAPVSLGGTPRARSLDDQRWRFPKEAGRHLLMVITSNAPLNLPEAEALPADEYLAALGELMTTTNTIEQAGFVVLDTADKPAPVAATPKKEPKEDTRRVAETKPSRTGPDPRCADIILKVQLGERLDHESMAFLRDNCR